MSLTVIDKGVERKATPGETAIFIAAAPIWAPFAIIGTLVQKGKDRQERLAAERAEREATEKAERILREKKIEEFRLAEEARAKEDNEIFARTNQLLALDIGGCIATIAKEYDNYTSVWEYRCTRDNLIIRTRGGDQATVCFHDSNEMMEDLARYRHCGFQLV